MLDKVLAITTRARQSNVWFHMLHSQPDALTIVLYAPGVTWEVDVHTDGEVVVQKFFHDGESLGEESLEELWADS